MQARLSIDILERAERSKFARTNSGRFTLRSKLKRSPSTSDDDGLATPPLGDVEYVPERRVLRTPKEEVLCAAETAFGEVLTFQGIDTDAAPILSRLLRDASVSYIPRTEAERAK